MTRVKVLKNLSVTTALHPKNLVWEILCDCWCCQVYPTPCSAPSHLQCTACLENRALRSFLHLGCGRKQDMAELGITNKELQVCSLSWFPMAETSGSFQWFNEKRKSSKMRGHLLEERTNVMGTSPWSLAEDIWCIGIHWYKADWLRPNLKALLRRSCSKNKHGASVSKIQHLCCNP